MARKTLTGVFAVVRNIMLSTPVSGCDHSVCRAWVEYKHGFGDMFSPEGEFWLGNEPLHHLTSQGVFFHLLHSLYQKSAFFWTFWPVHTTIWTV